MKGPMTEEAIGIIRSYADTIIEDYSGRGPATLGHDCKALIAEVERLRAAIRQHKAGNGMDPNVHETLWATIKEPS